MSKQGEIDKKALAKTVKELKRLKPVFERALNPTEGMKKALQIGEDFLKEIETEARTLGIYEQLQDVCIVLGYDPPRAYKNDKILAMVGGWKPKTEDYSEWVRVKGNVFAVLKFLAIAKFDLIKWTNDQKEDVIQIIKSGEMSKIIRELVLTEYTGKWFKEKGVPSGWVSLSQYDSVFNRENKEMLFMKKIEVLATPSPIEGLIKEIFGIIDKYR